MDSDNKIRVFFSEPEHRETIYVRVSSVECGEACNHRYTDFPLTLGKFWLFCLCQTFYPTTPSKESPVDARKLCEPCKEQGKEIRSGLLCGHCNTVHMYRINHASAGYFEAPKEGIECPGCETSIAGGMRVTKHECAGLRGLPIGCSRSECPLCGEATDIICGNCHRPATRGKKRCKHCGKDPTIAVAEALTQKLSNISIPTVAESTQLDEIRPKPGQTSPLAAEKNVAQKTRESINIQPSTTVGELVASPAPQKVSQHKAAEDSIRGDFSGPSKGYLVLGGGALLLLSVVAIVAWMFLDTDRSNTEQPTVTITPGVARADPSAPPIAQPPTSPTASLESATTNNNIQMSKAESRDTRPAAVNQPISQRESKTIPPREVPPPQPKGPSPEDVARRDQVVALAREAEGYVDGGDYASALTSIDGARALLGQLPQELFNSELRDAERRLSDAKTLCVVKQAEEKRYMENLEKQLRLAQMNFDEQRLSESKATLKMLLADANIPEDIRQRAQTLLDKVNEEFFRRMNATPAGTATSRTK